jgi:D-sedoheptulose 7-phosphate isomerase/D-glycero-D-manno-heptose 1,7-bisphosphate phosphatase
MSQSYVKLLYDSLEEFVSIPDFEKSLTCLETVYKSKNVVFLAGNGGSAAIVQHFSVDWSKGIAVATGTSLRTYSLANNISITSAIANDIGNEEVFAFQIKNLSNPGDVVLLVSSSGQSPNIIRAIQTAKELKLTTIGISGNAGGKMSGMCSYNIALSSGNTQIIEDTHSIFGHVVLNHFREKFGDYSETDH